jgi:serine/threonine protein kinase/WD40 repeat protein
MPSSDSSRDARLERLAEEFVERHRRGEHPALSEYADHHPDLAAEIRDLFPALVQIEHLKPVAGDLTGDFVPQDGPADGHTPERLGEYRILREVGHGGMGVVYEAEQESLGRHVALKVFPRQALLKTTYLERFRREAKAAAKLHHTNIVPVFGVGEEGGTHYYAMQFIRGEGLDKVLADLSRLRAAPGAPPTPAMPSEASVAHSLLTDGFAAPAAPPAEEPSAPPVPSPGPTAEGSHGSSTLSAGGPDGPYFRGIARVGLQVADALAYAHRQGILHRDIKPSNLLLDQQGTVWITDFGLAKAEGSDDLTQTGDIVGTIRYMAPERFDGRSLPQSDVYSLGLTLYELLTLRPAFGDTNKGRLIEKVLHEPPAPPRRLDPRVPRDLETIVLKCLAKEPAERYATAEVLAEDLRRFLADRPIKARRTPWHERTWRWCRRNPVVASLLGCVAMLLVTVAVVSTFSAVRMNDALGQIRQAEREARLREAEALVGQAHGIRNSRRPGQRFQALAALKKAAVIGRKLGQPPEWYARLRDEAIAALALPDLHITQELKNGFPPGSVWVEFSDDFELYVRTTEKGGCTVRRVADDAVVARLPPLGKHAEARFGSGRTLVVGDSSHRNQLWDLSGPKPVLRIEKRGVIALNFRPDGRLLAFGFQDGSIHVYEVARGKLRHRLAPGEIVKGLQIHLHPTAPFAAVSSYFHQPVHVRDLRTGAVVAKFDTPWHHGFGTGVCAWAPDGRMLAVPDGDSCKIMLLGFDPAAPALRQLRLIEGPHDAGLHALFNPAGDRLVTRGWDGFLRLFDVASGQHLFATHPLPHASDNTRFDRTGRRLAAARVGERLERVGLWSVADAREYRALVHAGRAKWHGPSPPALHPGGRLAALGFSDGVALFDLESGHEVAHLRIPRGGSCVAFDGRGNLYTNGFGGCFRWPVRPDPAKPSRLRVGPPQRLPLRAGDRMISVSRDGRVLAQSMWDGYGMEKFAGGWILHPNAPEPRRVYSASSVGRNSVSPYGRWVSFELGGGSVYDAATGRRVWQSPAKDGPGYGRFSPDGRWLATDMDGGRLYAAGTWKPGPRLGPGTPWDVSPKSGLAVLGLTTGIYRLVELSTGREMARLEDPEQNSGPAAFTPDGTKLVVAAKNGLRVWDLRRLRAELVKLGLDWDTPAYPPAPKIVAKPLEVQVERGDLDSP